MFNTLMMLLAAASCLVVACSRHVRPRLYCSGPIDHNYQSICRPRYSADHNRCRSTTRRTVRIVWTAGE